MSNQFAHTTPHPELRKGDRIKVEMTAEVLAIRGGLAVIAARREDKTFWTTTVPEEFISVAWDQDA